ncbi:MAG: hypothetical protein BWK73_46690 [Thiothrix lacustris]|uniref:Uncharacterized protein n=1 Tax=Thiothrix lacustris TaxID=525917 RepID=A0A1Y1QA92_9GAMM|nr:MAG: hypothetical protein BWK73_46690 [Thiothrix lacustris]
MITTHTNHAGVGTESGKRRGNHLENDPNGVDRQQELLGYLCKSETLAQHVLNVSPHSPLMEHAVQLCQGYLKTLLDMHHVWQCLQHARSQESQLGNQLERMQAVLQEVCAQLDADAVMDERQALQARYWNTISKLVEEVLHLPADIAEPADAPPSAEPPPNLPLSEERQACVKSAGVSTLTTDTPEPALKLSVHLFGEFKASLHDREIKRWPRGKGQKIFKYLLLHRATPVRKERLMETF